MDSSTVVSPFGLEERRKTTRDDISKFSKTTSSRWISSSVSFQHPSSSCDFSLTLAVHPHNSFVSCELHPIALSFALQDPPSDTAAISSTSSSSAPLLAPSSSAKKRRSSLGSDPCVSSQQQKKKEEKLSKKKKIQRIKSVLRYGCGGLLTLLFCCLVLLFVTSHVKHVKGGDDEIGTREGRLEL